MELLKICVVLSLVTVCHTWPRYGRPHPLYSGQVQNDILGSAFLLGLDHNEIQQLQAVGGSELGLGNIAMPNHGFPMNARERQQARQDVNTLTALGVIDRPEEGHPFRALVGGQGGDPPDNQSGAAKAVKKKNAKHAKEKVKQRSKVAGKLKRIEGKIKAAKTVKGKQLVKVQGAKITKEKIKQSDKSARKAVKEKKMQKHVKIGKISTPNVNNRKQKRAKKKKQSKANRPEGDMAENANTGRRRNLSRGLRGRRKFGGSGDPGEGPLAEQGGGDILDRPMGRAGGRMTIWRTGGEEGVAGGGDVMDRVFIVGR